jgi:ABC-type glycerol-3-phosphate transport system substrate-binding protein
MIEAFKKKHPNIDVIIEIAPWQTVDQQLLQATAAGKGPDVVRIYSPNLPIQVGGKSIIPLDSFFEYWTKEQREDFLFPQNDTVFDGKKMAFYGDIRTYLLWYRADMLDAKNVKLPHSLDELAEVARELTTDKVVGYAVGLSRASNATSLMEWFIPSLWGLGGELTKPDGTAAFSGEAGVRLLQWLQDLVYKYKVMPVGATIWTADTVFDMTKAGTVAMSSQGTHRVGAARAAKGIGNNLKTAPHPSGKASKPNPAMAAGQTFTMSKDAKDREAAWLFIEHMITPEMGVINAKVAGEMSTRKSSEKDPWFQSEQAADIRQWMAYVKEAGRAVKQDKILALSDFIATAAQEVVGMRVAPQKALDDAAKKWNQEIGRG